MTRKEFITLTFTLIGVGATAAACGTSNSAPIDASITGAGGAGGITGLGGSGGAAGAAGAGGAAGSDAGTSSDAATATCADPLPEVQDPDQTGHTHTVQVRAAILTSTTNQTITTSPASGGGFSTHTHTVTFTPANLATLASGGTVDVQSGLSLGHLHSYTVRCH